MKLKKDAFDWIVSQGIPIKCDLYDSGKDAVELSVDTIFGLQNGTLLFELFVVLDGKLKDPELSDCIKKIRLLKSQARVAIRSNFQSLTPVLRFFKVPFTERQIMQIANGGLYINSYCIIFLFISSNFNFFR